MALKGDEFDDVCMLPPLARLYIAGTVACADDEDIDSLLFSPGFVTGLVSASNGAVREKVDALPRLSPPVALAFA